MANKEIHIGDYVISETSRPYMIAEIGIKTEILILQRS